MPSRNPLHARDHMETVRTRRTAQGDIGGCNPNLADPPGLWVIIRFRFETPYWTAIGQSKFRSGLGSTRQLLKRLSTTMISTSRLFALLSAEDA